MTEGGDCMNETGIIIDIAEVFFGLGGLVGFYAALKLYLRQKKCKKKNKEINTKE